MKKLLFSLLVLSVFISGCITPVPSQKELISSTVLVSSEFTTGSGVVTKKVGNGYFILTNNHVIDNPSTYINIEFFDFNKYYTSTAKVLYKDAYNDLALLYVTSEVNVKSQPLCIQSVDYLEPVIAVGAGLGLDPYITYGTVSKPFMIIPGMPLEENPYFIFHTADLVPGNSGGPLFKLEDGKYCIEGLNARGHGTYAHISFAIPKIFIKEFLKKVY